jgi:pimeloyl-ACP methyl ester carboxylesterase
VSSQIQKVLLPVDGMHLSGFLAEPDRSPRGLILALHGGGARAAYWHSPVDPGSGLLELGARLGWRVLALDRPGYGASADQAAQGFSASAQGTLLEQALDAAGYRNLPVVLAGHSLGAIVASHMAAQDHPAGLRAVALGGVPLVYTDEQAARMALADISGPAMTRPRGGTRPDPATWYGPSGTWDTRITEHRRSLVTRTPTAEFVDARDAPAVLPAVMSRIAVPVQFAVAEFEQTTASASVLLSAAEQALAGTAGRDLLLVRNSGHNLSLGHAARGYHLRLLAFAEAALIDRPAIIARP